jgi:AAA+ ATPase superfamily predicted ATPase
VLDFLLRPERLHVALLGSGGIGKSSLAKAVINEQQVKDRFGVRRFFIRFDDILASQITYPTFLDRVARTLGVAIASDHGPILEYLEQQDVLLVLDNAETFLDPEAPSDVSRIKQAIEEFGGVGTVSILLTSRSKDLPHGLRCILMDVPTLIHWLPTMHSMKYMEVKSRAPATT